MEEEERGKFHQFEYTWLPAANEIRTKFPTPHGMLFEPYGFLPVHHASKEEAFSRGRLTHRLLNTRQPTGGSFYKKQPMLFFLVGSKITLSKSLYDLEMFECDMSSTVRIAYIGTSSMTVSDQLRHGATGEILADFITTIVTADPNTRRPIPVYGKLGIKVESPVAPAKLVASKPPEGAFCHKFPTRFSDHDNQRHTNQSVYQMLGSDAIVLAARAGYLAGLSSEEVLRPEVVWCSFIGESTMGDILDVRVWQDGEEARLLHVSMTEDARPVHYLQWRLFARAPVAKRVKSVGVEDSGGYNLLRYSWDRDQCELVCTIPALNAVLFVPFGFLAVHEALKVGNFTRGLFHSKLLGGSICPFPPEPSKPSPVSQVQCDATFIEAYYKMNGFEFNLLSTLRTVDRSETSLTDSLSLRNASTQALLATITTKSAISNIRFSGETLSGSPNFAKAPKDAFACRFVVRYSECDHIGRAQPSCFIKLSCDAINLAFGAGNISGVSLEELNMPRHVRNVHSGECVFGDELDVLVWWSSALPRVFHVSMKKNGSIVHCLEWTLFRKGDAAKL